MKKKDNKIGKFFKDNWKWLLSLAVVFAMVLVMPYSGDDLFWSVKSIGNYGSLLVDPALNGRYVGNFLVLFITKSALLRSIVTSGVVVGIAYIVKKETKSPLWFVWLLLILMPISIFKQCIPWASGFTNYTISTLLLLIILLGLRRVFADKASTKVAVGTSILVFINCFFLENVTLFLLVGTFVLNVVYFVKHKKVNKYLFSSFVASLLGTVLMFVQPTYHHVVDGDDFYRNFSTSIKGIIEIMTINYVYFMHSFIAFENVVLLLVITGALYLYYKKNEKDYSGNKKSVLEVMFYVMAIYLIYVVVVSISPEWQIDHKIQLYLNAAFSLVYIGNLLVSMFMLFFKRKNFWKLAMPILSIVGLVGPLMIVQPIGPRNFFVVYVLELIEALYILGEVKFEYKKISGISYVLLGMMVVYYTSIYAINTVATSQRDAYVKYISEKTNETSAVVPLVPFYEFVHYDDFSDKYMREVYNQNRNVREELSYIFVPYNEWVELMEKRGYVIGK